MLLKLSSFKKKIDLHVEEITLVPKMESPKNNFILKNEVGTTIILLDRISDVEKAISKISVLREELEQNSKDVKAEVQRSIGDQLQLMHQREVQLLRQVDAMISHQSSLLQLQLGRLYQNLGALRSTLQWVKQGRNIDTNLVADVSMNMLQICHLHYQPTLLDSLESSIQGFGCVEAKGSSVNVLMLPEEEDYGDGDHHVLHKTLDLDLFSKTCVQFPKFAFDKGDWLSVLKTKAEEFVQGEKEEKWLRDLERPLDLGDFEMSDVSETSESSIELLSHADVPDNNAWLQTFVKDNKFACSCIDNGNVEIENLDALNCCIANKGTQSKAELSVPQVSSVCRNGKCRSFGDCTCQESCLVACLKEQMKDLCMQDISKQDCINEVIRATTCLQPKPCDQRNWLSGSDSCRSEESSLQTESAWLGNGESGDRSRRFELPGSLVGFEAGDWLKSENEAKDLRCQNVWLSPVRNVPVRETAQLSAVRKMFAGYFEQHSAGKWVAHDSDNRVQQD